jgi:hypothetical protein
VDSWIIQDGNYPDFAVGDEARFALEFAGSGLRPGIPNLFHNWTVASIMRNNTPWLVEVNAHGGQALTRDQANESWANVGRTDAWHDDEGRSSYLLAVERRDA